MPYLQEALKFSGGVEAAELYELSPVVVTATKVAESIEKVPASVSVVTEKKLSRITILQQQKLWDNFQVYF